MIADTVSRELERKRVDYRVIRHAHTDSSSETAEAAHVTGTRLAKGVVLADRHGVVLAVLPAVASIDVEWIGDRLGRRLSLADEDVVTRVFADCEPGAVPAVGIAYGVDTIVDESLCEHDEVFFEGGDHEQLIGVAGRAFEQLLDGATWCSFAVPR